VKHKLFLIRDNKAEFYLGPYKAVNESVFLREIKTLKNSDTQFGKHPEDYSVYMSGEFDDYIGAVVPMPPVHLINLIDVFGDENV